MVWQVGQCIHDRYQLLSLKRDRPGHQVWLALDRTSQSKVILKTLAFTGEIQWDEVKLFEREIEVLRHLHHPRIPTFIDAFSQEDPFFYKCLVETYIHAPSLQEFLDRQQEIPEKQVWAIATQTLSILRDLHQLPTPLLHRDLKPSNILIDAKKQIYLIDLGAVGRQASEQHQNPDTPTTVGSYGYTPIEQFMGQAVPASDLFALGATLIQLLTATHPADLVNAQLRLALPVKLTIAAPLRQWLLDLTEPTVPYRLATANQAIAALRQAQAQAQTLRQAHAAPQRVKLPPNSFQLTLIPRWNSDAMATTDVVLLSLLGLSPLILGGWGAIAVSSTLRGFGLVGTEVLVLGGMLLPMMLVLPKLFWNLLDQTLLLQSDALQIQWRIWGVLVRQVTLNKDRCISFQILAGASDTWSIVARCQDREVAVVSRLGRTDVEPVYQGLERWLIYS